MRLFLSLFFLAFCYFVEYIVNNILKRFYSLFLERFIAHASIHSFCDRFKADVEYSRDTSGVKIVVMVR